MKYSKAGFITRDVAIHFAHYSVQTFLFPFDLCIIKEKPKQKNHKNHFFISE